VEKLDIKDDRPGKIITGFKQKMVEAGPVSRFVYLITLVVLQAAFYCCSLPAFVFLPAESYKKYFVKDSKEADNYQLRRLIILATIGGIIIILVTARFIGIVANASTDFSSPHPHAEDLLNLKNGKAVSSDRLVEIQSVESKNFW